MSTLPLLRPLPYHRDSGRLLALMTECRGLVMLDSGLGNHPDGRYDIISAWPAVEWRSQRDDTLAIKLSQRAAGQTHWQPLDSQRPHSLFSLLRDWLQQQRPAASVLQQLAVLPFCGGLIGYLGYHTTQTARDGLNPAHYPAQHPAPSAAEQVGAFGKLKADKDVAQALHGVADAQVGYYPWGIVVDHQLQKSWLFQLPGITPTLQQQIRKLEHKIYNYPNLEPTAPAIQAANEQKPGFRLTESYRALTSRAAYAEAFDQIKEWIYAGDCYQVNLAIAFKARYQGDPVVAYQQLRERSQSPFSAFIRLERGAVLSLSPERFLAVKDSQVTTQPIKGTRPRSDDPVLDARMRTALQESAKDRAENLMIVDLLRNDLGTICETGSVRTPELFALHSFSQVHHLVSTVTGTLPPGTSPLLLLERAFPGGSITGAPKIRAMQIIGALEPVQRSVYCGSIFHHDFNGRLDSSISIRTLLCSGEHIFCWAGGGIVADSVCDEEYQECHDKVSALIR